MIWFFGVVVVLAMGGVALVAAGRGAPMAEEHDDRRDVLVPAVGDLTSTDVRRVRFTLGFRGYRMSEVDALLARLADQLQAHEAWRTPSEGDDTAHTGAEAPAPADASAPPDDPDDPDGDDHGAYRPLPTMPALPDERPDPQSS